MPEQPKPEFNLPNGLSMGDAIWITAPDGTEHLGGLLDPERGKPTVLKTDEGEYLVPLRLEGPHVRQIQRQAVEDGVLDTAQIPLRIGGLAKTPTRYSYSADVGGHPKHKTETTVIETDDPDVIRIFDDYYPQAELLPFTLDRLVKAGLGERNVTIVTSDPHFVEDGKRASQEWNVQKLADFIPGQLAEEIAGSERPAFPDDGKSVTIEMETNDNRTVRLTTRNPQVKFALRYGERRGLGNQEVFRELAESGLGDVELEYSLDPKKDAISKVIAEMYGRDMPRKPTTGAISVEGVLRTFVDETAKLPPKAPEPPEVINATPTYTDEQRRKLNMAVSDAQASSERSQILQEAAEELTAMRKQHGPMNMKDFAAATTAIARRKGYRGKAFTEAEAQFSADAFQMLARFPDGRQEFKQLMSSFRPNTIEDAAEGRCDFCNSHEPVWEYPCEDFKMDTPNGEDYRSAGAWGACERCAMCIENNDRIGLVNRYLGNKPGKFHDLVRPWGIRLHNQFFRHRTGARVRADYRDNQGARLEQMTRELEEAEQNAGLRDHRGRIDVMSADHPDAPAEIAKRVRETGEVAMMIENEDGSMRLVAEGEEAVHEAIERRQIAAGYMKHPLLERYFQHIHSSQASHGLWRNTEAWHALAEKYGMTLAAAQSLGIPGTEHKYGSMYFDPAMIANWRKGGIADDEPNFLESMGLYITHGLHDSVPYLWTSKCDELAGEPDLPPHNITRGLAPHPSMFWSFEAAMGSEDARIDWMLVMETRRGYEVWCPLANDAKRDGTVMLTGALIPYGARWPEVARGEEHSLPEFLLKRLSFLNSKYTETPHIRAHRAVRRDVERNLKPYHHPLPDDLGAFVIHLRAPEPRPARSEIAGPGREINRKHCWWRRAHTRILFRNKPDERATWVRATLMGDTNLPLIRTTIVVDH